MKKIKFLAASLILFLTVGVNAQEIEVTPASLNLFSLTNVASTAQAVTLSGKNLTIGQPITVTSSNSYYVQVSLTPDGSFSGSVSIPVTATNLNTTIYVRGEASVNSGTSVSNISVAGGGTTAPKTIEVRHLRVEESTLNGSCGTNLTYSYNIATSTLTINGIGDMANYYASSVPWYSYRELISQVIIDNSVTSIGNYAFYNFRNLTSIEIPENVKSIGQNAFSCYGLSNGLTSITIPANVTNIGNSTFSNCSNLSSITISGNNITSVGQNAFNNTKWYNNQPDGFVYMDNKILYNYKGTMTENTTLVVPNGVVCIAENAFSNCNNLTSLTLSSSVVNIGEGNYPFQYCHNFTSISVENGNLNYSSENGVLFNADKTLLINCPIGKKGNYVIPNGVTEIKEGAFFMSKLSSINVPESMTTIGYASFEGSNITAFVFLNPTPIKELYFSGCIIYVPANSKEAYENGSQTWYGVSVLKLPDISIDDISVTPSENNTQIEWQAYENTEGYRITIYSDIARTDTIFILEFDAAGEWLSTISLRSADTNRSYIIENLQSGTEYFYTFEILGVGDAVLASLSDKFITAGEPTNIIESLATPIDAKVVGYYNIMGQKLSQEPEKGFYIVLYSNGQTEKKIKK